MNEYKLTLTEQDANLVLQALGELPARVSMQLISKIQTQAQAQAQAQPEMAAAAAQTQQQTEGVKTNE